eukprot:2358583-Pleurochrysis_carterae.AAC.1
MELVRAKPFAPNMHGVGARQAFCAECLGRERRRGLTERHPQMGVPGRSRGHRRGNERNRMLSANVSHPP